MRRLVLLFCALTLACSDSRRGNGVGGGGGGGGSLPLDDAGMPIDDGSCEAAAMLRSYSGCDYWPTVVANNVWSIFDFAVAVANGGDQPASISITGNGVSSTTIVQPNQIAKIPLPWVSDLKGPDANNCGSSVPLATSVLHAKGAYHLTSSRPVTVYQFNALEYKGAGGPEFKDWSACPGLQPCALNLNMPIGCFSFSNDASLLLPSTAMTGNYRVAAQRGMSNPGGTGVGPYIAVTATADNTQVTLKLSSTAQVIGGSGVAPIGFGGTAVFTLGAGDVVEVLGGTDGNADLSGSLIKATQPVQVIAGVPCFQNPAGVQACDHIEETVFPAETLGKQYVVTRPTGPHAAAVAHTVRLYGNVDGTQLTYDPPVANAPALINAGQVVDLGSINVDFRIEGDHELAVGIFMQGAQLVDPGVSVMSKGDPSQSFAVAVEQYRTKYVFLAPDDYDLNYVDVVAPAGTTLMLDGQAVTQPQAAVGATGFGVTRVPVPSTSSGAHVITGSMPFGIQVLGYGSYTSYQYPGGLDLNKIAPAPIG